MKKKKKKKNQARKERFNLNLAPVKKIADTVGKKNLIFAALSVLLFFGFIIIANVRFEGVKRQTGLTLSVRYKGENMIGNKLASKGKAYLVKNRFTSIHNEDLLEELYGFYSDLPEVESVHYVKRIYPRKVQTYVELRKPFVRVGNVLFDRNGYRLPSSFSKLGKGENVPSIRGLSQPKGLVPGEVWENIYFKETLTALTAVEDKIEVNSVTVPRRGGSTYSNGIVLRTVEGALVYWGKVFSEGAHPGVSVDKKVRNLEDALKVIASNMDKVKYTDISREKPVIDYR